MISNLWKIRYSTAHTQSTVALRTYCTYITYQRPLVYRPYSSIHFLNSSLLLYTSPHLAPADIYIRMYVYVYVYVYVCM